MVEEKVTLETAKLAKKKKFNWTPKYLVDVFDEEDQNEVLLKIADYYKNINLCILRPTQSLLQKWLREVHGLHVQPQKTFHNDTYKIGKILVESRLTHPEYKDMYHHPSSYNGPVKGKFKTYEEAMERGLQEALKLVAV